MARDYVVWLVLWCWRRGAAVAVAAAVLTVALAAYAATHLGLDTDESRLIASDLPFRRAERAFDRAFPDSGGSLVVVVDAASQAEADQVAMRLKRQLEGRADLFRSVSLPPGSDFFATNGLLYLPLEQVRRLAEQIIDAQPLIGSLARDPSLRGMLTALDLALEGVARDQASMTEVEPGLRRFGDAAAAVLAGRPEPMPWREMFGLAGRERGPPRALLLVRPVPDYGALVPGKRAAEAVRATAAALGVSIRLTGSAALADDNLATVTQGVELSTPLSLAAVVLLLFAAVHSARVVAAILACLVAGLAATAAFAAATVGTLNPISVAFAVMFVGIAVDFSIQMAIRIRAEQGHAREPQAALAVAARAMAGPLSLAAATTAAGFLSFVPTAYAGVAQLGLIAGAGMLIALLINLTLLPALLAVARPSAASSTGIVGLAWARKLDIWIRRQARAIAGGAALAAVVGLLLLPWLRFDFNPLNLQNPTAESVRTFRDLARSHDTSPYTIDAVTPDLAGAESLARRLDALPEVDHTITPADLVPSGQQEKLAVLADLALLLGPTLDPVEVLPPPSTAEVRAAMAATMARLRRLTERADDPAGRLALLLDGMRDAPPILLQRFEASVTSGLPPLLADLRRLLQARAVTLETLPADVRRHWLSPDGRIRVQAMPKGDMQDARALAAFVAAVQSEVPDGVGMPVAVVESGRVVVRSFLQAAGIALAAIAVLLVLLLRRPLDAVLVLLPLLLGGLYTVAAAVASGLAVNFANIIALPLLLGIGVAFNIYFVVNWRAGITDHLQSPTTRAVLFSAMTTGSAFGSLAISPHLGTASMGILLFLSLGVSVAATFVVLPAIFHLMGKPKT
jgi:hopanoid biosynthesis associated RND transporter like protein HpnN